MTPGPKGKNWVQVFELIREALQNDRWKREREVISSRFNEFNDNLNSERVFETINEILG